MCITLLDEGTGITIGE